jgi:hypothetical protein
MTFVLGEINPWTRLMASNIDIIIHVGGRAFPANKVVLMQHSGYFRSVLSATSTSLILPTVPPDYFAILLAAMCSNNASLVPTLTSENVYQLLLYGQLLQMPAIVLQCKAYISTTAAAAAKSPLILAASEAAATLTRQVSSTATAAEAVTTSSHVLRPIPNKVEPPLLWKPWLYPASLYQEWLAKIAAAATTASRTTGNESNSNFPAHFQPEPSSSSSSLQNEAAKQPQLMELLSHNTNKKSRKKKPRPDYSDEENFVEYDVEEDASGVQDALDIAACDGPVRFTRIINPVLVNSDDEDPNANGGEEVDVVSHSPSLEDSNTSNEAHFPGAQSAAASDMTYKCLFCNHVFKSHYCYQKHKRRHLNPFTVDFTTAAVEAMKKRPVVVASTAATIAPPPPSATTTASVSPASSTTTALKDINVQFFPCKICGAKFPSYYFVHKHKKIWHADVVEAEITAATTAALIKQQ